MRISSKFGKPSVIKLEKVEERSLERTAELCSQIARQDDASPLGKAALQAVAALDQVGGLLKAMAPAEPVTIGKKGEKA